MPGAAAVAAQARRDRARILRCRAEIDALTARVATLQRRLDASDVTPLSGLYLALKRVLGVSNSAYPLPAPTTFPGSKGHGRGRVLVIDHHWPTPDRDSGSIDIVNFVKVLAQLGFEVSLAATEELQGEAHIPAAVRELGIECVDLSLDGSMEAYLARIGAGLDLCVLCRVYCGGSYLEAVQEFCTRARIVFNSIDLNFLREERRAQLLNDTALTALLPQLRAREEHIIRQSDATILVSEAELALITETIPEAYSLQLPLARPVSAPTNSFSTRRGIGFIGGFGHQPNVDAITTFLDDIWPLVLDRMPNCEMSIVGDGLPPAVLIGRPGTVRYLGHLPDVVPWFESLRLTVAPLRFGAGAKGKIASSLAAGVPAVVSAVAAEGMALDPSAGVLTAGSAASFAESILRLHEDSDLWTQLSAGAINYAQHTLSLGRWQTKLDDMLIRLGF